MFSEDIGKHPFRSAQQRSRSPVPCVIFQGVSVSEVGKLFLKGPGTVGVEGLSVSVATIYFCCCAKADINSKYSTHK